ncbi:leucoanthocyanidin reductase isoform X2 [Elaeis guineensis]|uniref:Leucoanthocyanidin reductase isoform X2 n=1 Tax=Elaeis guineensis var. tenera TaxID=51953 RepID=A0A6J0PKS1_ELAGV|nr:leucoanthocyanidin reductase isoform X2 [Elaeis guineensis]
MTATPLPASSMGPALVIGATGYIGRFVAEACLESGRATYILVRPGSASPARAATVDALRAKGAIVVEGSVNDKDLVERKLREEAIEVVISVMGGAQILDQLNLLEAIKAVGSIKRFLPSEFGHDIDKADPVEPGQSFYKEKRKVRRAIEAAGIPYTYICCNSIAGWPYHDNTHPSEIAPPLDRFQIYGDGNVKENRIPASIVAALTHDIFINGCQVNFSMDGCKDVEITCLYPDISFRTIDECFNDYAADLPLKQGNEITSPNSMVDRVSITPTGA